MTYELDKYPMEFYMVLFFKGLMAVILYMFLTLIFFELMRRLFPKFAFFKQKDSGRGKDGSITLEPAE